MHTVTRVLFGPKREGKRQQPLGRMEVDGKIILKSYIKEDKSQ
jgi:hypothetical protein